MPGERVSEGVAPHGGAEEFVLGVVAGRQEGASQHRFAAQDTRPHLGGQR